MTSDLNKDIIRIDYNHLNLPILVLFNNEDRIQYTYDATGIKLEKKVTVDNVNSYTYYASNYIYEKDNNGESLQFFSHPEGYVEKDGSSFRYVYQYKDHLGNIRLSYSDDNNDGSINQATEIREENNYYPFGLKHKGYNNTINGRDHKYGYGNKEEQNELGLEWMDFHARNYDAALGRWMNTDPLAEKFYSWSPFNYTLNNPMVFSDPTGLSAEWIKSVGDNGTVTYEAEAGDSAYSLYTQHGKADGFTAQEANAMVEGQLRPNYTRESDGMLMSNVEVGDKVKRGSASTTSSSAPSTQSVMLMSDEEFNVSEGLGLASTLAAVGKELQYSNTFQTWTGKNGKMYKGLSGRGPNGATGSRGLASAKAGKIGMGGAALGLLSVVATEVEYANSMSMDYGPRMQSYLSNKRLVDQSANGSGFLGIYGAAASFGYNLGNLIEAGCNCNIQYNPYTNDFTPIEQSLMQLDRTEFNPNRN